MDLTYHAFLWAPAQQFLRFGLHFVTKNPNQIKDGEKTCRQGTEEG